MDKLQRAVKRGKEIDTHYRTFVSVLKDTIVKMGSWGPIEGADMEAVVKTIVDVNCTAWKKAMQDHYENRRETRRSDQGD